MSEPLLNYRKSIRRHAEHGDALGRNPGALPFVLMSEMEELCRRAELGESSDHQQRDNRQ
jgi:hypothetical protein